MKSKKIIIPLLIISSIFCGCSNNQTSIERETSSIIEEESTQMGTEDIEVNKLSKEQWMMINDDENICFSPASLKYAMFLLQAATNDKEAKNIGLVLGTYEENFLELNKQRIDSLNETEIVNIANAVITDESFDIKEDYVGDIKKYLSSDVINTKLSSPEGQETVNKWVSKHTNGKIKTFKVDDGTRALLMNAIYYKDKWNLFDENDTVKSDFFSPDGTQTVDMMNGSIKNKSLYKGKNYEMVEINLENSSILIYLPNEGVSLTQVANELASNETKREEYFDIINISMPKFKMEQKQNLNEFVEKNLGLSEIFYGNGLFPRISDEDLQVDEIIQKTFIEINEEGAEAAATTVISMKNSAPIIEDVNEYDFIVNRPFMYEIKASDETLFIGSVLEID